MGSKGILSSEIGRVDLEMPYFSMMWYYCLNKLLALGAALSRVTRL